MTLTSRAATPEDLPLLIPLVQQAIDELQQGFLDQDQIRASHQIMGIDSQLISDATYYVVHLDGHLAGCGGWSRRATLYGADHSEGRDGRLLDPATEPARVRAMYTHPGWTRRGVGRHLLAVCETAAAAEGFRTLELMATRSGRPLYEAGGFLAMEEITDLSAGLAIPLTRMRKPITAGAV